MGAKLHAMGWGNGLEKGDYILLANNGGRGSTRYEITEISYKSDPMDMWEAALVFAPRPPIEVPDQEQTK